MYRFCPVYPQPLCLSVYLSSKDSRIHIGPKTSKHWVVLLYTAGIGGLVTYMPAKITRAVGDVGVASFWLGPGHTTACRGGGGGTR